MARNKPLKGMLNAASPIKNTLREFSKGFYDKQPTHPSISESIPLRPPNPRLSEPFSNRLWPETPSNKNQIIKPRGGPQIEKMMLALGSGRSSTSLRKQVYKKYKK